METKFTFFQRHIFNFTEKHLGYFEFKVLPFQNLNTRTFQREYNL